MSWIELEEEAVRDAQSCTYITVPISFQKTFSYLEGTKLYFFNVAYKLNRINRRDKRICFVTDYTVNIASLSGPVSRFGRLEDIEELVLDSQTMAIGVRMSDSPSSVKKQDPLFEHCFFEMPVDLLLFLPSEEVYHRLIYVLQCVYYKCTQENLTCRPLCHKERWAATLRLTPDGTRVKKSAMQYNKIDPSSPTVQNGIQYAIHAENEVNQIHHKKHGRLPLRRYSSKDHLTAVFDVLPGNQSAVKEIVASPLQPITAFHDSCGALRRNAKPHMWRRKRRESNCSTSATHNPLLAYCSLDDIAAAPFSRRFHFHTKRRMS